MTAPNVFTWMVDQTTAKRRIVKPAAPKQNRIGAGRPFGFHQAVYDAIARGLYAGKRKTVIAEECGVHVNTVKNHARRIKAGEQIAVTRVAFNAHQVAEVARLIAAGCTAAETGKRLGLSAGSVHGIIRHRLGTTVAKLRAGDVAQ